MVIDLPQTTAGTGFCYKFFFEQQIFEIKQGQEEIKKKFDPNLQTNISAANFNIKQQLDRSYYFN